MKVKAVIGAAYGDEGKGLMTDYLTSEAIGRGKFPTVVRFNGGAQAGHTVTTPEGQSHVFHHLGSGSFLGAATYLTQDFIVNPLIFFKEAREFSYQTGKPATVLAHPDCMVTLPFDMIFNQALEEQRSLSRGLGRHGSCGAGINETVERSLNWKNLYGTPLTLSYILKLADQKDRLYRFLKFVRNGWFNRRIEQNIVDPELRERTYRIMQSETAVEQLVEALAFVKQQIGLDSTLLSTLGDDDEIIFEGAQGLMLDQNGKQFPFVTRSNTGTTNVVAELSKLQCEFDFEVVYMSRSYTTRHGAGPLEEERVMPNYVVDKTNAPNSFQGSLRYSPLNLDMIRDAIASDVQSQHAVINLPKCVGYEAALGFSCADQVISQRTVPFLSDGLQHLPGPVFVDLLREIGSYVSYGPTREHVFPT